MFFSSLLKSSFRKRTAKIGSFFLFAKVDDKLFEVSSPMTRYKISYDKPTRQFLTIEAQFEGISSDNFFLNLPNWRPGRYQEQHFAKRIKDFAVINENGINLPFEKSDLSTWKVACKDSKSITVKYSYHAALMDAGNTWLDDEQLYINFINCIMYTDESRNSPFRIDLHLPENYRIACGLEQTDNHQLTAPNYNILVDSPMFASDSLRKIGYQVGGRNYHLWIQGQLNRTDEELIHDFERFTQKTYEVMGLLPCEEYHFLFQVLPYKHYHGVEHWNSTVITIGPDKALGERERYADFLGVSCHELFHTWNVIRLRPKEMVPYEFQKPNLHYTGFITEGVTTYYGDLLLARSGVYSISEYEAELNKLLKRHFENDGRINYSVAESSFDLWLDGYEKGVPGRKVSIYNEGALAAMILDLSIRKKFNNAKSLDHVMRLMWERHGKDMTGYTWQDYKSAAEDVYEAELNEYFNKIIFGTDDYAKWLFPLLDEFGIQIEMTKPENSIESAYGFKTEDQVVSGIAIDSPAEGTLMLKDKITETAATETGLALTIERFGKKKQVNLAGDSESYYVLPVIKIPQSVENDLLTGWLEIK